MLSGKNNKRKDAQQRLHSPDCSNNVRRLALFSLCLLLFISGCVSTPLKPTPPLPIPESLFRPCVVPDYNVTSYGEYPGYVAQLMDTIALCNVQLEGLKKLQNHIN